MDEIKKLKCDLKKANEIKKIRTNPIVQSVFLSSLKSVPIIGDFVDSTTENLLDNFQKKKEQELIDAIFTNTNCITTEMINDVEFIINFNKTLEAVRRLATNDKIIFFGSLVRNGYLTGEHIENNIFEEYLNILNSLSYREIVFLIDFKKWSDKNSFSSNINNWQMFKEEYANKCNISTNLLEDIFIKMTRTGFVKITYREENIIVLGDNKKKRKKAEKKENKRAISDIYDMCLTIYFLKFYNYIMDAI